MTPEDNARSTPQWRAHEVIASTLFSPPEPSLAQVHPLRRRPNGDPLMAFSCGVCFEVVFVWVAILYFPCLFLAKKDRPFHGGHVATHSSKRCCQTVRIAFCSAKEWSLFPQGFGSVLCPR